jgi:hypothetical protein
MNNKILNLAIFSICLFIASCCLFVIGATYEIENSIYREIFKITFVSSISLALICVAYAVSKLLLDEFKK